MFCLPHAGGGAASFFRWQKQLGDRLAVIPILLPGRESRFAEPAYDNLEHLLDDLMDDLVSRLPQQYAFFGHSMGALIAFELTHRLQQERLELPQRLFLSAVQSPQLPRRHDQLQNLADDDLVSAVVHRYMAAVNVSAAEKELMGLMVKTLRADITLLKTHKFNSARDPLPCPFSVYGGREDPVVSQQDLEGWAELTAGHFELQMVAGDHFYLRQHEDVVCQMLQSRLSLA